jgi:archaeal chaperonin
MLSGTPIILLKEGAQRTEGSEARRDILETTRAVADAIRTTLGPRGLDKMLVDSLGDVVITNDGAAILQKMDVQHPAGKMLAEIAKAQDQECGDGTKTAVLLTGELVRKAEDLLDEKLHPTVITRGYQIAAARSIEHLASLGRPVRAGDTGELDRVAATSMISKGVSAYRVELGRLAVRAVTAVLDTPGGTPRFDRKNVQIVKRQGGQIHDSELLEGHVLEQEAVHPRMPKLVRGARIALLAGAIESKKTEFSEEIKITAVEQVQSFLDEEARALDAMVDAVVASGANVVITEKGIEDVAAEHLARRGIYAVRRAKHSDLELLARATGARIVARALDLTASDLGAADRVEERKIGDDKLTLVSGATKARAVALLVRGGTQHVIDEVERSLLDATITVGVALEDGQIVTGAGSVPMDLSQHLRDFASTVGGREQLAVEAFASALEVVPTALAENAGMDVINTLIELRRRHKGGERNVGVDALGGKVAEMQDLAVEPVRVIRQEIQGATETATMLLRIDDVIASKRTSPGGSAKAGGGSSGEDFA